MIQRLATVVVLIPVVLLSIFLLPLNAFIVFIEIFLALAVFELLRLLSQFGVQSFPLTYPFALLFPWVWNYQRTLVPVYLLVSVLISTVWAVLRLKDRKSIWFSTAANLSAIVYLAFPFALAADFQLRQPLELLLVLIVIWTGDISAYLVGRKWGNHKIVPRISPGKSLEGYAAGLSSSVFAATLFGHYQLVNWPFIHLMVAGVFIGLSGMLGDLFESRLKRGAGLKDSSNLIPGHGGILDRLDSLLFALPVYYLLSLLLK